MPQPRATRRFRPVWTILLVTMMAMGSSVAWAETLPLIQTGDPLATEAHAREHSVSASAEAVAETTPRASKGTPPITLERIHRELEQHVAQVRDVKATISFVQISERDGSKSEGELQLAAIFPDLVKATWTKPEIYAGVFYIVDVPANVYIEYVPATGEAHRLPLDRVLAEQPLVQIQLNPDQLFSLPPADQFDLQLEAVSEADGITYAVVSATERTSGQKYRIWVDTQQWLVTRMQMLSPAGNVQTTAEVLDLELNQGIDAAALRRLPPGTIQRTYP